MRLVMKCLIIVRQNEVCPYFRGRPPKSDYYGVLFHYIFVKNNFLAYLITWGEDLWIDFMNYG